MIKITTKKTNTTTKEATKIASFMLKKKRNNVIIGVKTYINRLTDIKIIKKAQEFVELAEKLENSCVLRRLFSLSIDDQGYLELSCRFSKNKRYYMQSDPWSVTGFCSGNDVAKKINQQLKLVKIGSQGRKFLRLYKEDRSNNKC